MEISVTRSGGFAGLTKEVGSVNTTRLKAATAQQLEQMVRGVGFFDLPATASGGGLGADMFRYEITVTQSNRHHTVAFYDDGSPETAPLRKLVDAVSGMS